MTPTQRPEERGAAAPRPVEVGARVAVESERVGIPARHGVVTSLNGPMVQVHWDDGGETSFVPAAGSMEVVRET